MIKSRYLPQSDQERVVWLNNFANKFSLAAGSLNLLADVASANQDAAMFAYIVNRLESITAHKEQLTSFKNTLRDGPISAAPLPVQGLPTMAAPPSQVASGIFLRVTQLVMRIKNSAGYTEALGQELGIEAPKEVFVAKDGKPNFFIEPSSGGYPNLRWTKGKFQGVEIWKDAGKGFVKLDRDMRPDFIDKSSLPASGESTVWKYKMIYLVNDEHVGAWSDVVSVTVHGEV